MNYPILSVLSAFLLFVGCKSGETPAPPPVVLPVKYENRQCSRQRCFSQDKCANFQVFFPQFSGGDTAAVRAVTQSIHQFILNAVGGDSRLPFEIALDSAGAQFCGQLIQDARENPGLVAGYDFSIVNTVIVNNPRILTIALSGSSFAGGAHPNSFASISTYDMKNKGRVVPVTAMVSDTALVLPLIEKAYKKSKGLAETDPLTDMVYPELKRLPLPQNICVVQDGIRFYYNDYEVAPHAVGPADVVLTWEQLGSLADKKKWFE